MPGAARSGRQDGGVRSKTSRGGHIKLCVDKTFYLAHIIIWRHVTGEWPPTEIDHRNGCGSDNWWLNLRCGGKAVNAQNLHRPLITNSTGYLGVVPVGDKFEARITVDNKQRRIGGFDTAKEAGEAHLAAKRLLHPGCTI